MENSKEVCDVNEKVPTSQFNRASIDPKVGCPIVCGQQIRASGFCFATVDETYLITTRHDVLPTDGQNLGNYDETTVHMNPKDRLEGV